MPTYFFASDLHLSAQKGEVLFPPFLSFIERIADEADHLVLLGDLFDYWAGDFMVENEGLEPVFDALRQLSGRGTEVTFVPGNRDFLLGPRAARRLGIQYGGDTLVLEAGGERLFATHGDLFCTFDLRYQRMRRFFRNPVLMRMARRMPRAIMQGLARRMRKRSINAVQTKTDYEKSLDIRVVEEIISNGFTSVICGHFHDVRDTVFPAGGRLITLSDWNETGGSFARLDNQGLTLNSFST